ncbi:tannase-domain-containing protein [Ophiobolus disseminans]|uniref:Carboxylic ester hydrolase n=1 Tax=Ophiobolus disseminans TaxID=1469910 RepID=A0A6A7AJN6_9PLEO|nr:tannase-domain-containing protein [Ophiobolus disseminans]
MFLFHLTAPSPTFEEKCVAIQPKRVITNVTRNVVQYIRAGTTLALPDNDATCNRGTQVVITFEAWLPETWTGRFLATGNGGLDGCIKYEDLAYTAFNGFASVGSNNGKNGTSGLPFYNNPEIGLDFAWRSLQTSVEAGKTLTAAFYGESHTKSYYLGCSLGGRQGIDSVDKFPDDFDGIVAGAPGVDFNNLVSWRARFFPITGAAGSLNFIPATAWKTWIHDEVLRQCDSLDGVEDGMIEEPGMCDFDPQTLLCKGNGTEKYEDGELIFPGMRPGSEITAADRLYSGAPFAYSEDWFKYVVYNNPSWDASKYSLADARVAEALDPGEIRTYPSSLSSFEKRGGKLLVYHGQQDNQITTFNTNRFYEQMRGQRSYEDMDKWVRYFRISGMGHCNSGPGAWVVGQGGGVAALGVPFDKEKNVLTAMVEWVERDIAPEYLEGTKFVNDSVVLGPEFTRRHCRHSQPFVTHTTMILPGRIVFNRSIITHLRSSQHQIQPCGIDLTLKRVLKWTSTGTIDFDNAHRKTSQTEELPFQTTPNAKPERDSLHLPHGSYLIEFNERIAMPLDVMGLIHVRSSLFRSGALVHAGVMDSGYAGPIGAMLQVVNSKGLMLLRNAKLAQMVVSELSESAEGYKGVYLDREFGAV